MKQRDFLDGAASMVPNNDGLITVWEEPVEGEDYFLGIDTAEGIKSGDWCTVEVVKGSDCAQVAEARGHVAAKIWGEIAAYLGWYYNTGLLAFETYPSAFGLPSCEAALDLGYDNIYLRQVPDVITKAITEKLGWATDTKTHPMMMERVRQALADDHLIRSEALLSEMKSIRWEVIKEVRTAGARNMKAVTREHDDLHDAYGIALCVRDSHYTRPQQERTVERAPATLQEWAWKAAKDREKLLQPRRRRNAGY
ncbi:MAG: hypothetical protein GY719_20090 [bacterium]|nr:hypothetical protein [bacterium]